MALQIYFPKYFRQAKPVSVENLQNNIEHATKHHLAAIPCAARKCKYVPRHTPQTRHGLSGSSPIATPARC